MREPRIFFLLFSAIEVGERKRKEEGGSILKPVKCGKEWEVSLNVCFFF